MKIPGKIVDINDLEAWDVVLLNKKYRLVLEVNKPDYITLVIRRCSWTHRPYTVIHRNDLKSHSRGVLRYIGKFKERPPKLLKALKECSQRGKDAHKRFSDCCEMKQYRW